MEFRHKLKDLGLLHVLDYVDYSTPMLYGMPAIHEALDDIILNNRKVFLYGDYDMDGLMCIMGFKEFFRKVNFTNYTIFKYKERTHTLDKYAITEIIQGRYDYAIICDTASSEMDAIKQIISFDTKLIVIDHHQTKYDYSDYPKNCSTISSVIENRMNPSLNLTVSAGALVFIVLNEYLLQHNIDGATLACYALVSLYADCIDMSGEINRGIYYYAMSLQQVDLPDYIGHFLNKWTVFCRRYIEFHYSPKLNSIFRSEEFELINSYMLVKPGQQLKDLKLILDMITQAHADSRTLVDKATDIIDYKIMNNFVVGNLNSVQDYINIRKTRLYNYTGLIANRLASRYGKSAVVWCSYENTIKGSFRDLLSRNYLTSFRQFCEANGHNSAFGIYIPPFKFGEFYDCLCRLDTKFSIEGEPNIPIVLPYPYKEVDIRLLNDIAKYNEFSGNKIPLGLIELTFRADMTEVRTPYSGYKYRWGSLFIQSDSRLYVGRSYLMKPVKGKNIKLFVV